jgi:hypothetical protein
MTYKELILQQGSERQKKGLEKKKVSQISRIVKLKKSQHWREQFKEKLCLPQKKN